MVPTYFEAIGYIFGLSLPRIRQNYGVGPCINAKKVWPYSRLGNGTELNGGGGGGARRLKGVFKLGPLVYGVSRGAPGKE